MTSVSPNVISSLAGLLRKHFLAALIACYLLAWLIPQPGQLLADRQLELGPVSVSFQLVMLAMALFVASLQHATGRSRHAGGDDAHATRDDRSRSLETDETTWGLRRLSRAAVSMFAWRLSLVAAGLLGMWISRGHEVMFGLLLVLCMPTALSAVPWTHRGGGDVGLTLGLIVTSMLFTPCVMLAVLGTLSLAPNDFLLASRDMIEAKAILAAPLTPLIWFAPPVIVGLILGQRPITRSAESNPEWMQLIPSMVILLLNYCNAASVLPVIAAEPNWFLIAITIGIVFLAVSAAMIGSRTLANANEQPESARVAIGYSSSLYNTGIALVLAADWFANLPMVLAPIMLFTLSQHLLATVGDRLPMRERPGYEPCPRMITTSPVSINEPR